MNRLTKNEFDYTAYLAKPGLGRRIVRYKPKHAFFTQGSTAVFLFYVQSGRAKLTVVSQKGKEATVTLLGSGDFVGEESLTGSNERHKATASAVTACVAMRIDRLEMIRALKTEHGLADFFLRFMIAKSMRTQDDLIDQLFNSSERRLARTLLLMAEYGKPGGPEAFIPPITQETLAEMIGTTRSRVSFFMNRFRKLGYVKYKDQGRIRINKSLLDVVLHDQLPEENSCRPKLLDSPRNAKRTAKRAKLV
jgi:CRP/FNR family transcriptional regulator, cyclic AMP receptor protein